MSSEDRIQFPGNALTQDTIGAHAIREHKVNGFYLKEVDYPHRFNVPRHWHTSASLFLILRGRCTEVHGTERWECEPHDVGLMPVGETHAESMTYSAVRSFIFEIEPKRLTELSEFSVVLDSPKIFHGGQVQWLLMRLYSEFRRMDAVSDLVIEGLGLEVAAQITRQEMKPRYQIPSWLPQARELLHDRFSANLSLATIAKAVGVHPAYLATIFRRHYGCTVGEYVRRLRVEFVSRELINSNTSVVQLALTAGFSDQSHLSKTFKQLTGMSPSQFRAVSRST